VKPAPFKHHAPSTLEESLEVLAQVGTDGKVLAGGQSLVPMMNLRLARPTDLVDLNGVVELTELAVDGGQLRIGAMVRQRSVERSAVLVGNWPLIQEALRHVGHVQIRNRGTIGGSLAHADPAAELPAVMLALEAELEVRSTTGRRTVTAADFFLDYYTTALEPTELLTEIRVPGLPPRTGGAVEEISRRHGDFGIVGAYALLSLDPSGTKVERARLTFSGAAPTPIRSRAAESLLEGQTLDEAAIQAAAARAVEDLDPDDDVHASAQYRRETAAVVAARALRRAAERARQEIA
jgi:aerobic carbon-monoxide dehydrogenase medium subunit